MSSFLLSSAENWPVRFRSLCIGREGGLESQRNSRRAVEELARLGVFVSDIAEVEGQGAHLGEIRVLVHGVSRA